jgi:hypothetical protein
MTGKNLSIETVKEILKHQEQKDYLKILCLQPNTLGTILLRKKNALRKVCSEKMLVQAARAALKVKKRHE